MEMNDMVIVSVDDHIIEPPTMWDQHLLAQHRHFKPEYRTRDDGSEYWVLEGRQIESVGLCAAAGRVPEEFGYESQTLAQMRKGCWDIDARIDDMNVNGILASLNFPSFFGMDGNAFRTMQNQDDALVLLRAYNDWHIDEWCAAYPGRNIPLGLVPYWNIPAAVEEIGRLAAKGCHAISISDNPAKKGCPSIHDPAWEPFWKACADNAVVINLHVCTGAHQDSPSALSPVDSWIICGPGSIKSSAAEWLHLQALDRYPDLKVALTEGGIGWIPYFLERADYVHNYHRAWTHADFGPGRNPSDRFREHFITCFIEDKTGLKHLDEIGVDNVCYECDYPHSDTQWPEVPERFHAAVRHMSDEVINKISHANALKHYNFDAITMMGGRDKCTVGALRELARDVDTTPLSYGGLSPQAPGEKRRPVTAGDIFKQVQLLNA